LIVAGEADDTSWLNEEPVTPQKTPQPLIASAPEDDWLDIRDANAGKVSQPFQCLIDACMRGTDRVMACNGAYLAYRPYNREKDKTTNPRTKERMAMFLEKGYYEHVGNYDEVQVYKLMPGNPYYHDGAKSYVVGTNYWADIRTAAKLAAERKFPEYHDFLGGMASAMKGGNRDVNFAKTIWEDTINQITGMINQMRQGNPSVPTEKEINDGFIEVRRARGIQGNNGRVLLNSNALQKVGFDKK
jgi:hypothetical protein